MRKLQRKYLNKVFTSVIYKGKKFALDDVRKKFMEEYLYVYKKAAEDLTHKMLIVDKRD